MSRQTGAALLLGKVKVDNKIVEVHHERKPESSTPASSGMAPPPVDTPDESVMMIKAGSEEMPSDVRDPLFLAGSVVNLKNQIIFLKEAHRAEVAALKEKISRSELQYETLQGRYMEILEESSKAVENTRDMLATSVSQNLALRLDLRRKVEGHQFGSRKDAIKSELVVEARETERELRDRLARMEIELAEKNKLLANNNSRILELDGECEDLEDVVENMKKSHKVTVAALKARNELLEKRWERSEQRRKLDHSGFRVELDELKYLLKQVDKNVSKWSRSTNLYGDTKGMEMQCPIKPSDAEIRHLVKYGLQQKQRGGGLSGGGGDAGSDRGIVAASSRAGGGGGGITTYSNRGWGGSAGQWDTDQPSRSRPFSAKKNLLTGDSSKPHQLNSEAAQLLVGYVKRQIKDLEGKKKNSESEKDDDPNNKIKVLFKNKEFSIEEEEEKVGKSTQSQK